jgi:hypothetical protein
MKIYSAAGKGDLAESSDELSCLMAAGAPAYFSKALAHAAERHDFGDPARNRVPRGVNRREYEKVPDPVGFDAWCADLFRGVVVDLPGDVAALVIYIVIFNNGGNVPLFLSEIKEWPVVGYLGDGGDLMLVRSEL